MRQLSFPMIKDIKLPVVKNVTIAIAREKNNLFQDEWKVYLINSNIFYYGKINVFNHG